MPYALRLQVIEADRVGNPAGVADKDGMVAGIRFSNAGPVDAVHVYDNHPGTYTQGKQYAGQWIDVRGRSGRRRVLQHYKKLRPEQPRGQPYLAPVMQLFRDLGTYTDAEIKAAVVSAFLTVFIETDAGSAAPVFGLGDAADGAGKGAGPAGDEIGMGPGAVIGLAKGESANVSNPGRPNPAFGPFVEAVMAQLGAGLFIGPEMLLKKYSTSYTSARAAFLDAWKHLLDMRTVIVRTGCQPTYETWLAEAVAIGRVSRPRFLRRPAAAVGLHPRAVVGRQPGLDQPQGRGGGLQLGRRRPPDVARAGRVGAVRHRLHRDLRHQEGRAQPPARRRPAARAQGRRRQGCRPTRCHARTDAHAMKLLDIVTAPWAIEPDRLREILAVYDTHLRGDKLDLAAIEARLGKPLANDQQEYSIRDGGVAVLPIEGVIAPKANMFTRISGGSFGADPHPAAGVGRCRSPRHLDHPGHRQPWRQRVRLARAGCLGVRAQQDQAHRGGE